jgi:hypothetical protein
MLFSHGTFRCSPLIFDNLASLSEVASSSDFNANITVDSFYDLKILYGDFEEEEEEGGSVKQRLKYVTTALSQHSTSQI